MTKEEKNVILAVFTELLNKPYSELNTFLGSETIKRMQELRSKLRFEDFCKERGIRYEDMTDEDFEDAYMRECC